MSRLTSFLNIYVLQPKLIYAGFFTQATLLRLLIFTLDNFYKGAKTKLNGSEGSSEKMGFSREATKVMLVI